MEGAISARHARTYAVSELKLSFCNICLFPLCPMYLQYALRVNLPPFLITQ
jgi:hypothetical protein